MFNYSFSGVLTLERGLARAAVAIGSEGRGLSDEVLALCERTMRIPMSARCESLNAATAAGIVLWEQYSRTEPGTGKGR